MSDDIETMMQRIEDTAPDSSINKVFEFRVELPPFEPFARALPAWARENRRDLRDHACFQSSGPIAPLPPSKPKHINRPPGWKRKQRRKLGTK